MSQLSHEMAELAAKWRSNSDEWAKKLEWIKLSGLRGWSGQTIEFDFPFVAIVGENGAGKSTVLQAVASVYRAPTEDSTFFPSDFFIDTTWEVIYNAKIEYAVREGTTPTVGVIQKPTNRWRETTPRRRRNVHYIDLRRMLPLASRTGYLKIAKSGKPEARGDLFDPDKLSRYSSILGKQYVGAGFWLTDADPRRSVPVISTRLDRYSGFHQGAGESSLADLLRQDFLKHSIVVIDELENSLHPRAQRRLVRALAKLCRVHCLQVIVTTHSPYVLEELPPEARVCIANPPGGRVVISGVSASYAMSLMDEEPHKEADVYVEDEDAKILLEEILMIEQKELVRRCLIIPYGAASVGRTLGQMVSQSRFPRPSIVFLDADQPENSGCHLLPGDNAPERVVFVQLRQKEWTGVSARLGREEKDVAEALESSMTIEDHHEWVKHAADRLSVNAAELWRALASIWANQCARTEQRQRIVSLIESCLEVKSGAAPPGTNKAPPDDSDGEREAKKPPSDFDRPKAQQGRARQGGMLF
jgi:predicted ATPase